MTKKTVMAKPVDDILRRVIKERVAVVEKKENEIAAIASGSCVRGLPVNNVLSLVEMSSSKIFITTK